MKECMSKSISFQFIVIQNKNLKRNKEKIEIRIKSTFK